MQNFDSLFWQGQIFITGMWAFIIHFNVAYVFFFNSPAILEQSGCETCCPSDHRGYWTGLAG